jgi:hypothetical protein
MLKVLFASRTVVWPKFSERVTLDARICRSRCVLLHGFPELSLHCSLGTAWHTGHRTAMIWRGVSLSWSTILISTCAGGTRLSSVCGDLEHPIEARLKPVATVRIGRRDRPGCRDMRFGGMKVHGLGRLRAPVAIGYVEIQRADAVLAGNALERNPTVHRFGCVMSHTTIVTACGDGASGH